MKKGCIAGKNEIAVFRLHFLAKELFKENICICLNSNDELSSSWQPSLGWYGLHLDIKILK